jgi:hypothetical protein
VSDEGNVSHHFRWKEGFLEVGSVFRVRVIDTLNVDHPIKRYRSDSDVQEGSFTDEELREMRYQDYLRLKAEFERGVKG